MKGTLQINTKDVCVRARARAARATSFFKCLWTNVETAPNVSPSLVLRSAYTQAAKFMLHYFHPGDALIFVKAACSFLKWAKEPKPKTVFVAHQNANTHRVLIAVPFDNLYDAKSNFWYFSLCSSIFTSSKQKARIVSCFFWPILEKNFATTICYFFLSVDSGPSTVIATRVRSSFEPGTFRLSPNRPRAHKEAHRRWNPANFNASFNTFTLPEGLHHNEWSVDVMTCTTARESVCRRDTRLIGWAAVTLRRLSNVSTSMCSEQVFLMTSSAPENASNMQGVLFCTCCSVLGLRKHEHFALGKADRNKKWKEALRKRWSLGL